MNGKIGRRNRLNKELITSVDLFGFVFTLPKVDIEFEAAYEPNFTREFMNGRNQDEKRKVV